MNHGNVTKMITAPSGGGMRRRDCAATGEGAEYSAQLGVVQS